MHPLADKKEFLVCPNCTIDQCTSCHVAPYHKDKTCLEFESGRSAIVCRFCHLKFNVDVNALQVAAYRDICNSDDCKKKREVACDKMLFCGHACPGGKNDVKCLPCWHEECQAKLKL